jgi:GNAT superfamily N-acetyltransferase
MPSIEVHPVRTPRERRLFLTFPWRIYRSDPLWVPPILSERRQTLDPQRGAFFERGGQAELFIAWRGGRPVGTICAAEDRYLNEQRSLRDCLFGFFECVDDYGVAQALLDQAACWAQDNSLETLYGPFNLDYENAYGLLVEGRDRPPVLLCGHTPSYYLDFVERYGFQPARGDNLAYAIQIDPNLPVVQRVARLAERVRRRSNFRIRSGDLAHWQEEADRIHELINQATAHLPDFIPWHRDAMRATFKSLLPIADPELILFAELDGRVIGWFPGIPNPNEALIHANGLRYPWNYLSLFWYMRRQPDCLSVKSVLVLPDYWDTGVAVLLFDELARRAWAKGYRWADLSLTSADNPDTPILAERAGAQLYKRYRVYRFTLH